MFSACTLSLQAQGIWNNKKCAVVLTYDDALDVHLDNAIPLLDSLNMQGTFYLIGSEGIIERRLDDWRKAAANGHELGNHTMFHPCDGSQPGRSFVNSENDLSKYTPQRAVNEILAANQLLYAIDGKKSRTFAYPCGDLKTGDTFFYESVKDRFTGARGVGAAMKPIGEVNLDNIDCYMIYNSPADYMIDLVKQAAGSNTLLVFLFHGVGGGHSIDVDLKEHSKLLHYLDQNRDEIWIATLTDVAEYIKRYQDQIASAF